MEDFIVIQIAAFTLMYASFGELRANSVSACFQFTQLQNRLLYIAWPLAGIKSVKKV